MDINLTKLNDFVFSYFEIDYKTINKFLNYKNYKNSYFIYREVLNPHLLLYRIKNPDYFRATFFKYTPNSTIMLSNLFDGWSALYKVLAKELNVKSCFVYINDEEKIVSPLNQFIYNDGKIKRTVYVLKERKDKWVFYEEGRVQPFENTDYYKAWYKKYRLNKKIMIEYCEKLGITKNNIIKINPEEAFMYNCDYD